MFGHPPTPKSKNKNINTLSNDTKNRLSRNHIYMFQNTSDRASKPPSAQHGALVFLETVVWIRCRCKKKKKKKKNTNPHASSSTRMVGWHLCQPTKASGINVMQREKPPGLTARGGVKDLQANEAMKGHLTFRSSEQWHGERSCALHFLWCERARTWTRHLHWDPRQPTQPLINGHETFSEEDDAFPSFLPELTQILICTSHLYLEESMK